MISHRMPRTCYHIYYKLLLETEHVIIDILAWTIIISCSDFVRKNVCNLRHITCRHIHGTRHNRYISKEDYHLLIWIWTNECLYSEGSLLLWNFTMLVLETKHFIDIHVCAIIISRSHLFVCSSGETVIFNIIPGVTVE